MDIVDKRIAVFGGGQMLGKSLFRSKFWQDLQNSKNNACIIGGGDMETISPYNEIISAMEMRGITVSIADIDSILLATQRSLCCDADDRNLMSGITPSSIHLNDVIWEDKPGGDEKISSTKCGFNQRLISKRHKKNKEARKSRRKNK